jgi:hypothetical protein
MFRKSISRAISSPVAKFALFFAALFSLLALAQYWFVSYQRTQEILDAMQQWADQIVNEVSYTDKWNLTRYRQAVLDASSYMLVSESGLLLDALQLPPALIKHAKLTDKTIFIRPVTLRTEVGEVWRLHGKQVQGGAVIVGVLDPSEFKDPDGILTKSLTIFGSSVESATKVNTREVNSSVWFAVLNDFGDVLSAIGGIPLKIHGSVLPDLEEGRQTYRKHLGGVDYQILRKPIMDSQKRRVASVVIIEDVSAESSTLAKQRDFSMAAALISWVIVFGLVANYVIRSERVFRQQFISLEEALRVGENQAIEFKEGLPDRPLANAIAAFANTNPGNIFLGVANEGIVVGLPVEDGRGKISSGRRFGI